MDKVTSHAIDLIESAYDLEKSHSDWLPDLIDAGAPILNQGLGVVGFEFVRTAGDGGGDAQIRGMHLEGFSIDFAKTFGVARQLISPECFQALTQAGYAGTWTEATRNFPEDCRRFLAALGYPDLLGITAVDPNGVGVQFAAPLSKVTKLTPKARERWQMLGAHVAAGFRLRQALQEARGQQGLEPTGLPHDAEAVFDSSGFRIVDAVGPAKEARAADSLRAAARRVDEARGEMRRDDPGKALEIWQALVSGRWSMVDWFDTDRRRFVLAMPNPPDALDPRGLTEQESQVVNLVVLGEPNKMIAYRVGLSSSRISGLLKSAMRKLGVTSRTQLVEKLAPMGNPPAMNDDESAG